MPRSVIQNLLEEPEEGAEDDVVDGAEDLEQVATEQLRTRAKKAGAAAIDEPGDEEVVDDIVDEVLEPTAKTAFDRQVQQAIAELTAAAEETEREKIASEDPEAAAALAANAGFFRKYAHLLSEQARLLSHRESLARFHQATKVASDLLADGSIELPVGKTLHDFLSEFSKHDLNAVKTAHELFSTQRLNEIGDVVARERPADEPVRADGSDASWLAYHPSLRS